MKVGQLGGVQCRAWVAKYDMWCSYEAVVWIGNVPLCGTHFPAVRKAILEPAVRALGSSMERAVAEAHPYTVPARLTTAGDSTP